MRANKKLAAVAGATLLATGAFAAPSVEIVNIQQQYPWTNTVDITYTVQGVKTHQVDKILLTNETYFVAFEAKDADGNIIPDVNGNTVITNALVNGPATEVAQWQPELGRQVANCTLTPSVFRGEENAYMIVNLETNALGKFDVYYEPMSTQEASNKRYNTNEYKTKKLVLRRVAAGTYTLGEENYVKPEAGGGLNSLHDCTIGRDYYIGIFEMTRGQWARLTGDTSEAELNSTVAKGGLSTIDWRGAALSGVAPAGVCGDLCEQTGLNGFDLPTESMWEIAARAGQTELFLTGATASGMVDYGWFMDEISNVSALQPVGLKRPNAWGLFDVFGNAWERVRDSWNAGDLKDLQPDGLVPITTGDTTTAVPIRGNGINHYGYESYSRLAARCHGGAIRAVGGVRNSARLAYVAD